MNTSERLMAERLNFVSRRGKSAENQRMMWWQNIRNERNAETEKFYCVVNGWACYATHTERQAKIVGLSVINELRSRRLARKSDRLTAEIYDKVTMIKLWEAER